jgi:PAP2 superfamily
MKKYKGALFLFFTSIFCFGQNGVVDTITPPKNKQLPFKCQQLIIPVTLIGYGIIGLESDDLKLFNSNISEEVTEHIDEKITIDDFSQYAPLATFFSLDLFGIKGKNNTKDKAIIASTAALLMGITVTGLKNITHVQRPDGTGFNSFPSGHTANAFMGAELLMQEYKNVSVWYGVSGYLVATGTGVFRMYNNRHWFTDVVAGAGIGILSAKAGYWLYPITSKWFTKKNSTKTKTVMVPFHDGHNTGIGFIKTF